MRSLSARRRAGIAAVVGITALLTFYPPWYVWWRRGAMGAYQLVNGDAMLYMTIARRSSAGLFTFDGETATNGFHPLWQWVLTAVTSLVDPGDRALHVAVVLALSTVLVFAGFVLCNLAIFKWTRSVLLSTLPIAGVYWILIGAVFNNQHYWEQIDGMECGLSVLFGGIVLYALTSRVTRPDATLADLACPTWRNPLVRIGLVLPFLILARLDDVFVLWGLALVMFLVPGTGRGKVQTVFAMGAPTAIVLAAYMLHNRATVGTWLPLSGMAKSGISVVSSTYIFLSGAFPPVVDLKNAVDAQESDMLDLHLNMFRATQMIYPALIALACMLIARRYQRDRPLFVVLVGFAAAVVLKVGYNLVNVNLWHQGTWYYSFALMLCSFFVAVLLGRPYASLARHPLVRLTLGAALGLLVLYTAGAATMRAAGATAGPEYALCRDGRLIDRALDEAAPGSQLLEFDDGALAFCLDHRAIHGFGFAADRASFEALREGRLLAHAHARGHDVLASAGYIPMHQPVRSSAELHAFLEDSMLGPEIKAELLRFDLELVYLHRPSATAFIRFSPRAR